MAEEDDSSSTQQVSEKFVASAWYANILFVLQHLQEPIGFPKTKSHFLKLKELKFCIIDQFLYWKDPRGMLLNRLLEDEAKRTMEEFHKGDCGGHFFLNTIENKIPGTIFY